MSKASGATFEQVRQVARLFGDARACAAQPALQRQIILDGSCKLVGADQGFFSEFEDFVPGRTPRGISTLGSSNLDPRVAQVTREWYSLHAAEKDAMGAALYEASAMPGAKVVWWGDVAQTKSHQDYGEFHEVMATVRLTDILDPASRHPSGHLVAMSLHRHGKARPFGRRERSVAKLIAEELQWLHNTRRLDVRDLVGQPLPPQLAALLRHLLSDKSAKQIAAEMKLSVHTIRDHTKRLYARLGIDSRERLMATLLPLSLH
jgi:DNA-binding CsgD family transcriptional regulator